MNNRKITQHQRATKGFAHGMRSSLLTVCLWLLCLSSSAVFAQEGNKAVKKNGKTPRGLTVAEQKRANQEANAFDLSTVISPKPKKPAHQKLAHQKPLEGPLGMGLKRLTARELAEAKKHALVVKNIQLNKIGLARINAARKKKDHRLLVAGEDVQVAPAGYDVVGTIGSDTVEGGTVEATSADAPLVGGSVVGLPAGVDNSQLQFFPPIRHQGSLGSCAQWTAIYYVMTHEMALAYGWDAKNGGDFYRFSPLYTYNFLNGGANVGTNQLSGWFIAMYHGVARWSEFPYQNNTTIWCTNPDVYRRAIGDRIQAYGMIDDVNTEAGLQQIKEYLNNGHILSYSTYINSWQAKSVANDPGTPDDDFAVGKYIAYKVNGTAGAHGMTVVGYNDDIWCDIDGDGTVDPTEKGALRIANSWGTTYKEAGYTWIAYDALRTRNPAGGVGDEGIFWDDDAWLMTPLTERHTPTVVARITLNHNKRNQVYTRVGIGATDSSTPERTFFPYILSNDGGAYAFSGAAATPQDFTYYLDFSDLAPSMGTEKRWFVQIDDSGSNDGNLTLKSFELYYVGSGEDRLVGTATGLPVVANGSTEYAYIDWRMGDVMSAVTVTATDAGAAEAGQETGTWTITRDGETSQPLTVNYSLSGAATQGSDYSVSSSSSVTIPAGQVSATVTLTPVDDSINNEGDEIATLTIEPGTGYVTSGSNDTITITDNDYVAPIVTAAANPTTVALSVTPGSWTPDITMAAWYDASDAATITASGGAVSQWADKSGNGNHATQSSGSLQPTTGSVTIGGLNALSFPSGAVHRLNTGLTQLTTATLYYVLDPDDKGNTINSPLGSVQGATDAGGCFVNLNNYGGSTPKHGVTYTSGLPYSQKFLNGVAGADDHGFSPGIFSHQGTGLSTEGRGYTIGVPRNDNLWWYEGKISELIICPADHDEATRQKLEGYLAHKWGLEANLPVGHPYKSAAPDGAPAAQVDLIGTLTEAAGSALPLTSTWSVESTVPAGLSATITNPSAEDTTAIFYEAGVYTLKLTADDGRSEVSDSVVITVNGDNGVTPNAGADQTVTTALAEDADESITLDGSGSTSTNGAIVSYSWSEGGTEIATGVNPTVTLTAGSHLITLTVTDDTAATATDTVTITVNRPPSVTAAADPTTVAISGTSGPWTPADLTTAAWYDPSDLSTITESGGAVSQWNDKSGNNLHLSSSVGTPTVVAGAIGGRTALDFTSNSMTTASNPFGATISDAFVIAVHKVDAIENGTLFVLSQDPADNSLRYTTHAPWSGGGVFFDCGATTGDNRVSGDFGVSAGDVLISGFYGSVTDNVQQIYKNGALLYGDTNGHSVTTIGNMHIGGNPDSPSPTYQNTTIGEVVIINGTVSAADRQKLEGYLAHKWGLEANLPAGHPYKSAAPVNTPSAQVNLLGTASDLDTGDTLATTWTVTGGDAAKVSIANTSALNTTATFTAAGTYTLTLTADDGVAQRSDSVVITVTDGSGVTYTVTFDLDGKGTSSDALVQTVNEGAAATAPTVTANTGWTFTSWDVAFDNVTSDLTVTAQYTAVVTTYTVTFDLDGKGTSSDALVQTVNEGAAATAPTVTANTGWTFTGWDVAFDNVTSDLTVTAQYTAVPVTYTVTFDLDGKGTSSDALVQTVNEGAAATAPTVTANTGWTFTGWDVAFDNVTSDLTVTAQYTAVVTTYTVTFDLDGKGTSSDALVQTVNEGAAATAPTVTANTGWTFTGWDVAFDNVTSDLTVTAQYTAVPDYLLTVVDGTGSGNYPESTVVPVGATIPANYHFVNWTGDTSTMVDTNSASTTLTMLASPMTVTANTAIDTYTVTFVEGSNGSRTGGGALVQTVDHGSAAVAPAITANTGWTFTSWDVAFDNVTSDLTVTAQYTAVTTTYTVTFDLDGKGTSSDALVQTVNEGAAATAPTVTANTGWTFTGWDVAFDNVTSDLTVTAQYAAAGAYTLTVNNGSGSGNYAEGASVAITATVAANYHFVNWTGDTGALASTSNASTTVTMPASAVTVTANTAIDTYTVTFVEGSNGSRTGGGALVQTVDHGSAATAPAVTANTGWTFTGWDVAFDSVTSDLTVTAQYDVITYTVTFVEGSNGTRTGGGALIQVVNHGSAAVAPAITANSGYMFTGWDAAFDNVTSNLTVTAQYSVSTGQTVSISVDTSSIIEDAGVATVTATLSSVAASDVTVALAYTGTATGSGTDYSASADSIVITAGNTTGTVTVTAVQDTLAESSETILIDIASVTNATEFGTQQVNISIADDDTVIGGGGGGGGGGGCNTSAATTANLLPLLLLLLGIGVMRRRNTHC